MLFIKIFLKHQSLRFGLSFIVQLKLQIRFTA